MLETIKILQQNIQGNKKEIESINKRVNATKDTDELDMMHTRINILVGENRGYMTALALIKRDLTEATDFIYDFEPRLEIA